MEFSVRSPTVNNPVEVKDVKPNRSLNSKSQGRKCYTTVIHSGCVCYTSNLLLDQGAKIMSSEATNVVSYSSSSSDEKSSRPKDMLERRTSRATSAADRCELDDATEPTLDLRCVDLEAPPRLLANSEKSKVDAFQFPRSCEWAAPSVEAGDVG